jgi:hypothetical protein
MSEKAKEEVEKPAAVEGEEQEHEESEDQEEQMAVD